MPYHAWIVALAVGFCVVVMELAIVNQVHAESAKENLSISCQVVRPDQPIKTTVLYKVKTKDGENKVIEYYY